MRFGAFTVRARGLSLALGAALLGLAASAALHARSWYGEPPPSGAFILHLGLFVVWIPMILLSEPLLRGVPRRLVWATVLLGRPPWMAWAIGLLVAYAFLNFGWFIVASRADPAPSPVQVFRAFSGHWMALYAAAALVLSSALKAEAEVPSRRCVNGHPVRSASHFCEICDAAVQEGS